MQDIHIFISADYVRLSGLKSWRPE